MKLKKLSSKIYARSYQKMTVFGKSLMATGGVLVINATATCQVYNISENSWSRIAPMNEARYEHATL